jgi:hypothetical protein
MKICTAVVLMLAIAATAAAQSTRVESIAEEQAEKAKQLGAEGPGRAEQVIRRVLLSPLLAGGDGPYPWFGSVYSGTGMGLGAGYLKRLENAAMINLQTGISLNNSTMLRGAAVAPALWRGRLQVDGAGEWMDARGVSFYGLGPQSSKDTRQRYDYTPLELAGNVTLRPMRFVSVTGSYSFINIQTHRDLQFFTPEEMPGIDEELTYHATRGAVAIDWRHSPSYSTRGGFYRASFERHHETDGAPFSFTTQQYELVQLVPLVREQFVLAARALMTLTTPDDGDQVPVMLAPFLGSRRATWIWRCSWMPDRWPPIAASFAPAILKPRGGSARASTAPTSTPSASRRPADARGSASSSPDRRPSK